jgi:hypothetical protein
MAPQSASRVTLRHSQFVVEVELWQQQLLELRWDRMIARS